MPLQTMDLDYIKNDLEKDIFDFDYEWTDIEVGEVTYDKNYIEDAFYEYWKFYQIGYSTLAEFEWRLQRKWLSSIKVLAQKLNTYPIEPDLAERKINRNYTADSDNKYSDTPNQPMLNVDPEGKYLTDRTVTNNNYNSNITETKNEVAKFAEINSKFRDVLYDWVKEFDGLFLTDCLIYNYINCKRSF